MRVLNNGEHEFLYIDRNFLQNTPMIISVSISYEETNRRLLTIEKMSKSINVSFEDIVGHCYELVQRFPLPLIDIDVDYVVRCRPNYESDGRVYSKVSDLSYNPNVDLITSGRFNIEKEPMFYASLPSEAVNGSTSLTAILEAYKKIIDKNGSLDDRFATVSRWNLKKHFMAINFSMDDKAALNNLSVSRINYFFFEQMKQTLTAESFYSFLLLCRFMSEKAANKIETDAGYLITNAYKKAIEIKYGKTVNAIVYSSAMSDNHGLNIAISKDLIDNGDIEFHGASVYKIKSHPYQLSKTLFPCTNYATADSYGNFKFKFHHFDYMFG